MDVFLALILMAFTVESFHIRPSDRMYHGHNAEPHSAPYIISLKIVPVSGFVQPIHICGGSILNEYWVLSAGHCILSIDEIVFQFASLMGYAGAHDFQQDITTDALQIRRIVEKLVHPEIIYPPGNAPTEYADLSLLRVDYRFEFNEFVQKIAMAPAGYMPSGEAIVYGWGDIIDYRDLEAPESNHSPSLSPIYNPLVKPNVLQTRTVTLQDQNACNRQEQDMFGRITDTFLCSATTEDDFTVCIGDSGGPLVQYNNDKVQLIGVVAFASMYCGRKYFLPSTFTRVTAFEDWIFEQIERK